jgi:1-acyl-sn-glycerol-3-phosphate acyltransferase
MKAVMRAAYEGPGTYALRMPPYDHDFSPEPRSTVIRRRLVTVPRSFALLFVLTIASPVVVLIAALVDGTRYLVRRRPAMTLRLLAFGWVFLAVEAVGILWMAATWVRSGFGVSRKRLVESTWPIQRWWARTLFRTVQRIFDLRFVATGFELARPGPVLAMFRHASIIDNLLPAVYLTDAQRLKLRWIVKRELLTLPSLDIAGKRLPNYFVDRASADPRNELRAIRALSEDLDADEGILLYPEGTRFTEAKRTRALERMATGDAELLTMAQRMHHVLPPRLGGAMTLFDAGLDVLVVAHEGLGGFASISEIWSGSLVGRTIPIRAWRHAADSIPDDRRGRARWLYQRWAEMDDWIASTRLDQAS